MSSHILVPEENPEKPLALKDARAIAIYKARTERRTYVIWWVMGDGYISLPEGIRPQQFFVSEEAVVLPTYGE